MNMYFSTNRKFKRVLGNILSICVILAMAFPVTGNASAQESVPFILANPADDFVHGYEWPLGTLVAMEIDDPSNGIGVDFTDVSTSIASWWDGPPTVVIFELQGRFDLQPGDVITLSGADLVKVYTITDFAITTADLASNVISGATATAGAQIQVCSDNVPGNCRFVVADVDGNWIAPPDPDTFVLQPGAEGWASEYDIDKDQTYARWSIPAPQIFANPVDNTVGARGMSEGTELTMTIAGTYSATAIVGPAPYNPNDMIADFPMAGFDVEVGQVITVEGGGVSTTYTVTAFTIIAVDPDAETVSGMATAGAQLQICANALDHCVFRYPVADSNGNWLANFNQAGPRPGEQELFDIQNDSNGWGNESDNFHNQTWTAWSVPPPPLNPWFTVFHPGTVEGWNWPLDAVIHMTIDDPGTEVSPDFERDGTMVLTPWDPESGGTWLWIEFSDDYPTKPGDIVTLTDGVTRRTHVVRDLSISDVDLEENLVTGTAGGEQTVSLWSWEDTEGRRLETTADPLGNWSADFDDVGFDLESGHHVRAEIWDEDGDDTAVDWYIASPPNPRFTVFPEWEWFDGWDWPDGATVTITVEDKLECATTKESSGNFFNGSFGQGCDVAVGDLVTFTDGTTTRTHTVRNLDVTAVNQENETVSGAADAGAEVYVWPHATGQQLLALTDENGNWQVDFTGIFDLAPGQGGRSQIYDETGNATAVDWEIRTPSVRAHPEWESVDGWFWPLGSTLQLIIDDPGTDSSPDLEMSKVVDVVSEPPDNMSIWFDFAGSYDLKPGDIVTVTDGVTTRRLIVSTHSIDTVNLRTDTASGTAEPGTQVRLPTGVSELMVTANAGGHWFADFKQIGFDLTPGITLIAEVWDEDGDNSSFERYIPNPRFTAFPEWEWFDGLDWPDGSSVTITVRGKPECRVIKESWGGFFNGNFGEGCDLVIGDRVTFTDGNTTRRHIVRNLAVTATDPIEDTITGNADPGTTVYVWPHDGWFEPLQVIADDAGVWQVDLGDAGYDLQGGASGRSEIRDELGNATAVDWYVPYPHLSVFPEWEAVEGYEWPDGAVVTASVEGKEGCVAQGVAGYPEWNPWNTFVSINFPEGCDVQAGHVVTLSDSTTTLTYTVENLAITGVDHIDDTVVGTADDDALINVWPHATGQQVQVTASEGTWQVDFTDTFDMVPGESGRAEIRDEAGNATAVDWYVPNPRIVASITEDWFYLNEFASDALLSFSIYESPGGSPIWEGATTTDNSGWAWVDAAGRWDLESGRYLIVSDGVSTKDLVVEGFTFDVFDVTRGVLKGTAPEPFARRVWVGIGWENDSWSMDVSTNNQGDWLADFGTPMPNGYGWVAAQIFDADGDASELRPARTIDRGISAGNFYVDWSNTNPEEIVDLRWNGSVNLTNTWTHPACPDDLEFFGNSWASEQEGEDLFYFGSLVGWGTTGTWREQNGPRIRITSKSSGCPGSENLSIKTDYQFFDDPLRANLMVVKRTIKFGDIAYTHDFRPFIPRLYPSDGFTEVLHPSAAGDELITDLTCDFGCVAENWNGSWFAIHNPTTGVGMIVQRKSSDYAAALWLDDDDGSFTNSSSILLLQPAGGFTGTVAETEYLCFYDSSIWTPSLTLPEGCLP